MDNWLLIVVAGIFLFREPVTFWRMFFLFTLIGSIVGLKAIRTEYIQ